MFRPLVVMHPTRLAVAGAAMLAAGLSFLAGCSSLPERDWPARDERSVVATYAVTNGNVIEVPVSSPHLTILELVAEPASTMELWRDGRRWLQPPAGCDRLVVRCRYCAYDAGHGVPTPQQLFATATIELSP